MLDRASKLFLIGDRAVKKNKTQKRLNKVDGSNDPTILLLFAEETLAPAATSRARR